MAGAMINGSIVILGTIALMCAISYYMREKDAGRSYLYVLLMGVFAAFWCYGFGFMGMMEGELECGVGRAIGLISIVGYLIALLHLMLYLIELNRLLHHCVIAVYSVISLIDIMVMIPANKYHHYVQIAGRTAYYIQENAADNYHKFYLGLTFLLMLTLSCTWLWGAKTKQNKRFIMILISAHTVTILSIIPDTILPKMGMPSFPSTCYGVAITFLILWYGSSRYNTLSITVSNVSDYVFQSDISNILVFEPTGRLYMANNTAQRFLGLEEVNGEKMSDLFQIDEESGQQLFEEATIGLRNHMKLHTKNADISCSLHFTVAKDRDGKPYCTIVFVNELTKEEEMMEQLETANRAKSDFLARMSHEIRTPLNAIIGMNEMIIRESDKPEVTDYAVKAHNSSNALLALINDILDISKIEAGKIEIVDAEYDLSSLFADCYNMIAERAKNKNLDMVFEIDEKLPKTVYGDQVRVRQVLINLLTNAVKYTHEGSVTFTATATAEERILHLKFAVKDTGIGMEKENLEQLFQEFVRFDLQKNQTIEGTGLGLSITKSLIDLMNGTIQVESTPGKGSVFTVELPQVIVNDVAIGKMDFSGDTSHAAVEEYHESYTAPDARVLVVDDVEMNLEVVRYLLKKTLVQIETAAGGAECLKLTAQKKYDVIFMDHMMPGMDGIETLHALYQDVQNPNIPTPVIMMTANAISGMKEMYLSEGFTDYITKPIQGIKLEKILAKYLPSQKIIWENKEGEETMEENWQGKSGLDGLAEILPELDLDLALPYCAGSKEFLWEMLVEYSDDQRRADLENFYQAQDWKNYQIQVHALKSTSLTLGLPKLSEEAKALEMACKEARYDEVLNHHGALMEHYGKVLKMIRACAE